MRAPAIALVAAVGGALLVPAVPLAEDLPAGPVAALDAADGAVVAGAPVRLDSSRSTGTIVDHRWDLDGNGSFETDTGATATADATPAAAGSLTVRVRVIDGTGQSDDAKLDLTVTAAPQMSASAPSGPAAADPGNGPPDPAPAGDPAAGGPGAAPTAHADPAGTDPAAGGGDPGKDHSAPHLAQHHQSPGDAPSADPHADDPPAPAPAAEAQPPAAPAEQPAPIPAVSMAAVPLMQPATLYAAAAHPRSAAAKRTAVHAAAASGVTIKNFAFNPGQVTVHVGDTVTWSNSDSAPHTATASNGSFDTGIINKGSSASHTFTTAGTISYVCSVHPNMHGTVVVAAASGSSAGSGGGGGNASPSPSAAATTTTTTGGLPHTGLNLIVVALIALMLTGSGRVLRRIAR